MKFAFIAAEKAHFPVQVLCAVLGVTRAGFYAARGRPPAPRTRADQRLAIAIAAIHAESRRCYGSPRVHAELRARGERLGRKRVARLMRAQGLRVRWRRRFRTTTNSDHAFPIAPNLVARRFTVPAPNTTWVTDLTYVWTREGWMYVVVVLDLFSRRVVGWAMSPQMGQKLALDALAMALARRHPPRGLIHHSDRGSQYASRHYRQRLATHGIVCSMSRRGDCWDNAVAESFFATLKRELVDGRDWATRAEARAAIFEYVEVFYNGHRRHSALGYLSPVAFERQHEQAA